MSAAASAGTDSPISLLRAGLAALHDAAADMGLRHEVVDAVVAAAWDAFCGFDASAVSGFQDVVAIAVTTHGLEWATLVLIDPRPRELAYLDRVRQGVSYARRDFRRVPAADQEAAAWDAIVTLRGLTLQVPRLPRWTIWSLVKQATNRQLVAFLGSSRARSPREVSTEDYLFGADGGETQISERVVADIWFVALKELEQREDAMVADTRQGPSRDKMQLVVDTTRTVLVGGSSDTPHAERVRREFTEDPERVVFAGMRTARPATWGRYPSGAVPTREVIAQVAAAAVARSDPNADWFGKLEGRRADLVKGDRTLRSVLLLVTALLQQAARGATGE